MLHDCMNTPMLVTYVVKSKTDSHSITHMTSSFMRSAKNKTALASHAAATHPKYGNWTEKAHKYTHTDTPEEAQDSIAQYMF